MVWPPIKHLLVADDLEEKEVTYESTQPLISKAVQVNIFFLASISAVSLIKFANLVKSSGKLEVQLPLSPSKHAIAS